MIDQSIVVERARKHLHLGLGNGAHSESKEWFCAKDMYALRP
jgi:hypothetical protein